MGDLTFADWLQWFALSTPGLLWGACWTIKIAAPRRLRKGSLWYNAALCLLLSAAGSTVVSLLLARTPPVLMSHVDIPFTLVIWAFVMFTPKPLFTFATKAPISRLFLLVGDVIDAFRSSVAMSEVVAVICPKAPLTVLFLGALAGSAGGMLSCLELRVVGGNPKSHASSSGFISLLPAVWFYMSHRQLPPHSPDTAWFPMLPQIVSSPEMAVTLCLFVYLLPLAIWTEFFGSMRMAAPFDDLVLPALIGIRDWAPAPAMPKRSATAGARARPQAASSALSSPRKSQPVALRTRRVPSKNDN